MLKSFSWSEADFLVGIIDPLEAGIRKKRLSKVGLLAQNVTLWRSRRRSYLRVEEECAGSSMTLRVAKGAHRSRGEFMEGSKSCVSIKHWNPSSTLLSSKNQQADVCCDWVGWRFHLPQFASYSDLDYAEERYVFSGGQQVSWTLFSSNHCSNIRARDTWWIGKKQWTFLIEWFQAKRNRRINTKHMF